MLAAKAKELDKTIRKLSEMRHGYGTLPAPRRAVPVTAAKPEQRISDFSAPELVF